MFFPFWHCTFVTCRYVTHHRPVKPPFAIDGNRTCGVMGMLRTRGIQTSRACLIRLCTVLICFSPYHAFTQDGSSALNGVVEDITGARVPSAAVAVANPETGFHREVIADALGNFSFAILLPGRYILSAWSKDLATPVGLSVELYVGGVEQVKLRLAP